jgi:haloalkane dehalogenase
MAAYRAPFLARETRLPTLTWPRQIPVEGEPADVTAIVESYGEAMSRSGFPKLLVVAEPGVLIKGRTLEFCRTWPNQTEVSVKGLHFLQEDSPDEIGTALQEFVKSARGPNGSERASMNSSNNDRRILRTGDDFNFICHAGIGGDLHLSSLF